MRAVYVLFGLSALLCACDDAPQRAPGAPEQVTIDAPAGSHTVTCQDEPQGIPGFTGFHARLVQAIESKDADFIAAIADSDIKFSFGGEGGKAAFLQEWNLHESPQASKFWPTIATMLALGGYVERNDAGAVSAVVYPCTFRELPSDNWLLMSEPTLSAFDYQIVVTEDARLMDADGQLLRPLEKGEVVHGPNGLDGTIRTYDGLEGTAAPEALRSPVDYRMFLTPADGTWKLTYFIAGD